MVNSNVHDEGERATMMKQAKRIVSFEVGLWTSRTLGTARKRAESKIVQ
jgi:hypothetical protein